MRSKCQHCGLDITEQQGPRVIGEYCSFNCYLGSQYLRYFVVFFVSSSISILFLVQGYRIIPSLLGIIAAVSFILALIGFIESDDSLMTRNTQPISDSTTLSRQKDERETKNQPTDDPRKTTQRPADNHPSESKMMYIEDLNLNTLKCCYQTARLDEQYCPCGRAVSPELKDYLNP